MLSHAAVRVCPGCDTSFPEPEPQINLQPDTVSRILSFEPIKSGGILLQRWRSKSSGRDCLRMVYLSEGTPALPIASEYFSVEGRGRVFFVRRWSQLFSSPAPETLDEALVNGKAIMFGLRLILHTQSNGRHTNVTKVEVVK
jgi:hypothetical protein